jgi:hypothetical protein
MSTYSRAPDKNQRLSMDDEDNISLARRADKCEEKEDQLFKDSCFADFADYVTFDDDVSACANQMTARMRWKNLHPKKNLTTKTMKLTMRKP